MANITMQVKTTEYEQSPTGTVQGYIHRVTYSREGNPQVNNGSFVNNGSQYDVIDDSLAMILRHEAAAYRQGAITIEGATIPESLKTFLVDKYEAESLAITSVTFA